MNAKTTYVCDFCAQTFDEDDLLTVLVWLPGEKLQPPIYDREAAARMVEAAQHVWRAVRG